MDEYLVLNITVSREFEPSWNAVAHSWSKAALPERNQHFFATLDFDNAQLVFQKVSEDTLAQISHLCFRSLALHLHQSSTYTLQPRVLAPAARPSPSNMISLSMYTLFFHPLLLSFILELNQRIRGPASC